MTSSSSDEYLTIKTSVRFKKKVEGSIFIATAIPVESEEAAEDSIEKISKEFFDATHNCFAWRIGKAPNQSLRFSDAGEPKGTAGKPILSAIQSENLHNVLIVVTRYFGGIKLGTGGLSRAYRQSAQSVLQKADKATKLVTSELVLSYPLSMTGRVNQVFGKYSVRIKDHGFEEKPTARIMVRATLLEKVKKALVQATNAQVEFK
ncbi:MAG: YigZ family protein [candidate division Zixibacteria bacterium]|nr:YigZ family protein [candidate division Zixibacteria bacterium]